MTPAERWLATLWPLVRDRLPAPPARVVDIGCGPLGCFVPMLLAKGYDAVGIDPQAPEQPHYRRIEFERAELPPQVDAIVASTSLHHVADPATAMIVLREGCPEPRPLLWSPGEARPRPLPTHPRAG